jgi:DHA2 family multidrug resistance protein
MFTIGMELLASAALLAPYLQTLAGYPVLTAGFLMAPRGLGTMAAMMIAGRLANKVDPRMTMFCGVAIIAATMWQMTGWTPDVDERTLLLSTIVQGFGLGLVFTPLQVVAFATIEGYLRTDGAAMMSLVRNIGMAIGISVTSLVREDSTQTMHAHLASEASPFNRLLQSGAFRDAWNLHTTQGLASLDQAINQQASIIAYVNDFKLMMMVCLPAAFLLMFMRRPKHMQAPDPAHAVMD